MKFSVGLTHFLIRLKNLWFAGKELSFQGRPEASPEVSFVERVMLLRVERVNNLQNRIFPLYAHPISAIK